MLKIFKIKVVFLFLSPVQVKQISISPSYFWYYFENMQNALTTN